MSGRAISFALPAQASRVPSFCLLLLKKPALPLETGLAGGAWGKLVEGPSCFMGAAVMSLEAAVGQVTNLEVMGRGAQSKPTPVPALKRSEHV
ncbi:MAG: hypothetical protein FRX49_01800 [Trebouxia sp. A1-2]|nr:MAG: hypothetical protein FRX49_01800 [Trebouxia sp. A1-2]